MENTPNLWDIPNGIVAIPTLKFVRVSNDQRFLCCAFEMKRAILRLDDHSSKSKESLCPTTVPASTTVSTNQTTVLPEITSPASTTEDILGGFGKRRKRRQWLLPTDMTTRNTTVTRKTEMYVIVCISVSSNDLSL